MRKMNKRLSFLAIVMVAMLVILPTLASAAPTITVDVWENNPHQFWSSTDQVWNPITERWETLPWRYFGNETTFPPTLNVPPLENQTGSFDFTIISNVNASMFVSIISNDYPGDGWYVGPPPIDDGEWLASSGNVIAATGPDNLTTELSGHLNAPWWTRTGWYRMYVSAHSADYDDTSYSDEYYFFMNSSLDSVEMSLSLPLELPQVTDMIIQVVTSAVVAVMALPKTIIGLFLR